MDFWSSNTLDVQGDLHSEALHNCIDHALHNKIDPMKISLTTPLLESKGGILPM